MEDLKRGLPGIGCDSFMTDLKCNFCGQKMDDYAETFPDGEYTRTIGYRCINKDCPGPPKLLKKKELLEFISSVLEDIYTEDKSASCIVDEIESGRFDV